MAYDFANCSDRSPPNVEIVTARADDLETLVVLLELAAITLTKDCNSTFTAAAMIQAARDLGGDEIIPNEADLRNVIDHAAFLTKVGTLLKMK